MANKFEPTELATIAAKIVGDDTGLAAYISRDVQAGFKAGAGSTVRVRIPGATVARVKPIADKTTPIVSGELTESGFDVKLEDHVHNSIVLSEEDLSLNLKDFSTTVVAPQMTAVSRYIEQRVAAALQAAPETTAITYDEATPAATFTQLRRKLRDNGVSADEPLTAIVGSKVYADLLDGPTGSSGTTFDASGKVRGFEVIESNRLGENEIVGFIRGAFTLVVRAPEVPSGAPHGASVSADGFALRWVRSFDASTLAEHSIVSTFLKVAPMPLVVDKEDGTIQLVENGGVVRVNIATPAA